MTDQTQLPPGISAVFVMPDQLLSDVLVHVITVVSGISPEFKRDSESAKRAIYPSATSRNIINTASEAMHERLGRHTCCVVIPVDVPIEAATKARNIFRDYGYTSNVFPFAEPEMPPNFLVFTTVDELGETVLLFVPKAPDTELLKLLPPREPWTPEHLKLPALAHET